MGEWADLEQLGYAVDRDDEAGVVAVAGFGVACVYAAGDAAALAALAQPAAHADRRLYAEHPEAVRAVRALLAAGYVIARVDDSADTFNVTTPLGVVLARPLTPRQIVAYALNNIVVKGV